MRKIAELEKLEVSQVEILQQAKLMAVMYGGTILEHGPAAVILSGGRAASHPYTAALMGSIPNRQQIQQKAYLKAIKGEVLDTINLPEGCRFYPRCEQVTDRIREHCRLQEPDLLPVANGHRIRCWRYRQ